MTHRYENTYIDAVRSHAGECFVNACVEAFRRWACSVYSPGRTLTVALSGGTTPEPFYRALARGVFVKDDASKAFDVCDESGRKIPSDAIRWFQTDERCVPTGYPESNQRMIREALFNPEENRPGPNSAMFHGVLVDIGDHLFAAQKYEQVFREFVPGSPVPSFDLILLGVGEDGHIASLFPGTESQIIPGRLFQSVEVSKLGTRRFTMTPLILEAARLVVIMAAGPHKADVVENLLAGRAPELPAARLIARRPVVWWLDNLK
ncbi:MAG: 6-phosphogluconolactonase [Candidatus Riflebacteria bacterium]|nr:6-phosphogluconolactonase [Candidatus Riflebacteria bacterium]